MISLSRSSAKDANRHKYFTRYRPKTIEDLALTITREVWSPIQWVNDERGKRNFESARIVALDFDQPGIYDLAGIVEMCQRDKLSHIIGTTKSHQKQKMSDSGRLQIACDRFRLLLFADTTCRNVNLFEWNMIDATEIFDCDRKPKDGGRFFWPCKEIISVARGSKWQWTQSPEGWDPKLLRQEKNQVAIERYHQTGRLPPWIARIIINKAWVMEGERDTTCYKLGANLPLYGWKEPDIVSALLNTNCADIGEQYVRRAVRNGIRASESENRSK